MSREELTALCVDLEIRANQDCEWNMRDQQSEVTDQLTWELGCRTRRDYARDSYDNVCHPANITRAPSENESE